MIDRLDHADFREAAVAPAPIPVGDGAGADDGSGRQRAGAGGMRDIVAPAAFAPEADMEAISNHASVVADALAAIMPKFRALEATIGAEDAEALLQMVSAMVTDAHALATIRN